MYYYKKCIIILKVHIFVIKICKNCTPKCHLSDEKVAEGDTPLFFLFYYFAIKCRLLVGSLYKIFRIIVQDWYTDYALKCNQKMHIYQISNAFLFNLWAMLTVPDAQFSITKRIYNRSSHSIRWTCQNM